MSIQLFLIRPYSTGSEIISEIPVDSGGITDLKLTGDLKMPYILDFTANQNLRDFYDILADLPDVGLRLKQVIDGDIVIDIAFVKDRQPQINRASGKIDLSFKSSLYLLSTKFFRTYPYFTVFSGATQNILNALSSEYIWELVGQETTIELATGTLKNIDIINKIMESANFSFRELGVDANGKTRIQYGDLRDLQPVGEAVLNDSGYLSKNSKIRIVGEPKLNLNGDVITHLFAYGQASSGTGADKANSFFLTDPNASYIDKGNFPLIDTGLRDGTGKILYVIYNTEAASFFGSVKTDDYPVNLTTNVQNEDGSIIITEDQVKRAVYRDAVNFLRSKSFGFSYGIDFDFDKIYLPGSKILVNFQTTIENDKQRIPINIINEEIFLKNVEIPLTNFI